MKQIADSVRLLAGPKGAWSGYYRRSKRAERRYQAKLERAARKKQFKARRKPSEGGSGEQEQY